MDLDNSIFLIDKPAGITSYKAVDEIKRISGLKKAGHSGTLDKFASGLLVICTGFTTKFTRFFLESEKRYCGRIRLGIRTDTCDSEGKILEEKEVEVIESEKLIDIRDKFRGEIFQVPPEFSALKIEGKRASDLIRQGKKVDLKERKINISKFDIFPDKFDNAVLNFDIICSKGTYVRAIARDIGDLLGTGAYLEELRRLNSGNFNVDDALTLKDFKLYFEGQTFNKHFLLRPNEALSDFGTIVIKNQFRNKVLNGVFFMEDQLIVMESRKGKPYRILDEGKELLAIAEIDTNNWKVKYLNVFNNIEGAV